MLFNFLKHLYLKMGCYIGCRVSGPQIYPSPRGFRRASYAAPPLHCAIFLSRWRIDLIGARTKVHFWITDAAGSDPHMQSDRGESKPWFLLSLSTHILLSRCLFCFVFPLHIFQKRCCLYLLSQTHSRHIFSICVFFGAFIGLHIDWYWYIFPQFF